ncbi:MAG: hypothetical protein JSS30_07975 [Verrucomicrobia bacterium]|nr:hypothetical protein [Verrucomicrobiota bacterium]
MINVNYNNYLDFDVPASFNRVCPTFVVKEVVERARVLFSRILTPGSASTTFKIAEKTVESVRRCLPDDSCFDIESTSILERLVEEGREIANTTAFMTRVIPIKSNTLYDVLFGSPYKMTHQVSRNVGKICETLMNHAEEVLARKCYEGPFDGRLVSKVCTFTGEKIEPGQYTIAPSHILAGMMGLFCLYKAGRAYHSGRKMALAWGILSVAAAIAPSYLPK